MSGGLNHHHWARTVSLVAGFSLLSFELLTAWTPVVAATISTPRVYMNSQKAGQTTGQQFEIFFTEASGKTGTDNEIHLVFPDGDDGEWCRTAGSLTITGITNPTGATESATALVNGGSWSATCAQGSGSGSAEANSDRLIITGVGALSSSTLYGVRLVGNTAVLGTASPAANNIKVTLNTYENNSTLEDTGYLALSLVSDDQVLVTASTDVTLTVTLSANSINLGTLDTANVSKGSVQTTVSTSAAGGYTSLVKYDQTLTSGSNTIPDASGGTIVAGATSEYGASSSDSGNAIGVWSPTSCTTGATTSNATALSTTFQAYGSNTTAVTNEATTLCFLATIDGAQAPGTYTSTATLVTTALF